MDQSQADRLYHDPLLVQFYDLENEGGADQDYCARLAEDAASVLDLGCGTGQFATRIAAPGRIVHGVDPAPAMLDVAQRRRGGDAVTWTMADARSVRLGRRFDLVVLTGHAFQCFLTQGDRLAVLGTIGAHLAPEGRFIFDSRNPMAEEWREWIPDQSRRTIRHAELGDVTAWNDVSRDPASGVVTYETHYRTGDGRAYSAASQIAFPSFGELSREISASGLTVEQWLGSWDGAPHAPSSPEIIPFGQLADQSM